MTFIPLTAREKAMLREFTIWFYRKMLWWMEYGQTIARSTGRNPAEVAQSSVDIDSIKGFIHKLEIQQ
jgi:hypothetical protein